MFIYICVYSGDLCDYEIYLSLSVYCSDLTRWGVQIPVGKIGERWLVGLSGERVDLVGGIHGGGVREGGLRSPEESGVALDRR